MLFKPDMPLDDFIQYTNEAKELMIADAKKCDSLDDASEYLVSAEYYQRAWLFLKELREMHKKQSEAFNEGYRQGRADEYSSLTSLDTYEKDAIYTQGYQDGYIDCKKYYEYGGEVEV